MQTKRNTLYYAARIRASELRPELANRERAGRELYVSADVLYNYETGATAVPCAMVQRMVEVYGDEQLRLDHVAENCPLMMSCPQVNTLERAALELLLNQEKMQALASDFARMAMDGRITPDERARALEARGTLLHARNKFDAAIAALDQEMHRSGGR